MGMTLKELLTKGEGTLTAGEAKTLASQCRMDVETLYTLLEERGIKILDDEADGDTSLDVEGIMAEVESAEANSDELGLGDENEDDPAEENPADLKAAMDELLDDPVKNYLKQIGQIPLLSAEQEVDLSKRIHAGAEAAHILQADRQKYGAPEYIKKNSARFSFEEDENSRSYTEDLDEDGNTKSSEDDEEKAAEEEAEKQAEVEAQATHEQANAASRNESRSSVTYSDASGSVSAGAGASIDRAYSLIGQSMDCTALVSQALAARGINFHGWPEEYVNVPGGHVVTDGSLQPGDILIYANTGGWNGGAHYDHVALYVGNGQAVHGGWNGYSVALASAMTEKLTIVVRIP